MNKLWGGPQAATIAVVDSGIDESQAELRRRRGSAQVSFVSSRQATGPATVAGTARSSRDRGGQRGWLCRCCTEREASISLDVMDDSGSGRTSDVIAAAEWIYQNKAAYNIRVANFSLHTGAVNHFWLDPLNVAVSKLWTAASSSWRRPATTARPTGRAA